MNSLEGPRQAVPYASKIDEGTFDNGTWVPRRRLNGDELHVRLGEELEYRLVKLYRYN